ncbi:hypothetical protein MK805_10595 [Shimazuella sp. AN120528]|uniref:hypothetical protein n=1 Tax=Shimazuella soli TaxID=1892854 RepID=UPI001F0FD0F9|nr:hypothetical protein [Shimazuella soli]MCH5585399.1 hypothetical protein [Shimazuella soli]
MRRIFNTKVLVVVIAVLIVRPDWAEAIQKHILLGLHQLLLGLTQLKDGFVQLTDEHKAEFVHKLIAIGDFMVNNTGMSWVIHHWGLSLIIAFLAKRYIDPVILAVVNFLKEMIEVKIEAMKSKIRNVITNVREQRRPERKAITSGQ